MGEPSSGLVAVGYDGALVTQAPAVQFVGNPNESDTLVLENRYGGPLAIQWADSDIQIGPGLIAQAISPAIYIPPFSRCVFPWPTQYGVNVLHRQTFRGATLLGQANQPEPGNIYRFQRTTLRYLWMDLGGVRPTTDPLYPDTARFTITRSISITMGQARIFHVLPYIGLGSPGFTSCTSILDVTADVNPGPPSIDARIMRVALTARSGTAGLNDMEISPMTELSAILGNSITSQSTPGGIRPFGSSAAPTSEHQPTEFFNVGGVPGVALDIDAAGAATSWTGDAIFEVVLPYD